MSTFSSSEATILQTVYEVRLQLAEIKDKLVELGDLADIKGEIADIKESIDAITVLKDSYSTREVADVLGVTQHHVQARLCAAGRIECEKDQVTGRWRIPGREYDRLRRGGRPAPT